MSFDTAHFVRGATERSVSFGRKHGGKVINWGAILTAISMAIINHFSESGSSSEINRMEKHLTYTDGRITALEATNEWRAGFEAGQHSKMNKQ